MAISIRPVDPARPHFAAEVSGIDLTQPIGPEEVGAIEAGMDRYAVLVFHDQTLDDAQQVAFSRHFGPLEQATGDIQQGEQRRLSMEVNDISNLDQSNRVLERDDRRRLFGLGNMLWHSDSSFKPTPAKYSLLSARIIPEAGGNTEFADMRAGYDALDEEMKALVRDLVCEHSQIYSRGVLGFTEFTEEERRKNAPVRAAACAPAPRYGKALAIPLLPRRHDRRLAGAGSPCPAARPDRARDAARVRLCPPLAAGRFGHVGQPGGDAPCAALQRSGSARHAADDGCRHRAYPATGGLTKTSAADSRWLEGRSLTNSPSSDGSSRTGTRSHNGDRMRRPALPRRLDRRRRRRRPS